MEQSETPRETWGGTVDATCTCPDCGCNLGLCRRAFDVLTCRCGIVSVHTSHLWPYRGRWLYRVLSWRCDVDKLHALYATRDLASWSVDEAMSCRLR